jgi:periplasmic copper chaperone A
MKKYFSLLALASSLIASSVFAADYKIGNISIDHVWARATPPAVKNGSAFMTLSNSGATDKLLSVTGAVAKEIQIHSMATEAGVMRMREVKSLDVPAGGKVELKSGGYHVMLLGLSDGLKDGMKFPLTLKFEKAGEVTVQVMVETAGGGHDHSEHKH